MKILLADKLSAKTVEKLSASYDVHNQPKLNGDALRDYLCEHKPDILVVRSTKVTAEMMQADIGLELIIRAGSGYDNIDITEASKNGIFVSNCPGMNATAVAELTIGLITAIDRRIPDNVSDLRSNQWNKELYSKSQGLKGKTLGLIGTGNIAMNVREIAAAMGLDIVMYSRSFTEEKAKKAGVRRAASVVELAKESDIVSVHVPKSAETKHLINAEVFNAMKSDAIFINTSRADVVDEDAMVTALEKGLRVGTDVMSAEPAGKSGPFEHRLFKFPNCYGTHHIGASTQQAEDAVGAEVERIIATFLTSDNTPNCVNIAAPAENVATLAVRHKNKVGVLSAVFDMLKQNHVNVLEMDNRVFTGSEACCARVRVSLPASIELYALIKEVGEVPDVIHVAGI